MFEGLVRQLLLGYLGQYIKDFQKEQLKITLWNEEVLLENVELILEAFDYLQLPVSLKRGGQGRSLKEANGNQLPNEGLVGDPSLIILTSEKRGGVDNCAGDCANSCEGVKYAVMVLLMLLDSSPASWLLLMNVFTCETCTALLEMKQFVEFHLMLVIND
ncbi:hypothetical protein Cgig2_004812 [Carnegiea gigantea]|uniref:Chorein N-terminal domain-containing protein n=1 Tax=Carnegiea gigantea TaxID=171969 RepID=A0A9Q1KWG9_9CARY|nr:hypothetical protein Cgig2_004812 [Carnegiea gigantea]